MRVVVGLRNPGTEYAGTRHNVGFEVVAELADRTRAPLTRGPKRVAAEVAEARIGEEKVVLVAPLSYMNESGGPVSSVLSWFKAGPDSLLVVHDDIDLAFGRLRLQVGGGSGGHNGIRSLEKSLGTREFSRLKVGVGRPPGNMDPADYVLRRFASTERGEVEFILGDAADVVESWVENPGRAQEQAAHRSSD